MICAFDILMSVFKIIHLKSVIIISITKFVFLIFLVDVMQPRKITSQIRFLSA